MSQFAGQVSRVHKLKKEDHKALIRFSAVCAVYADKSQMQMLNHMEQLRREEQLVSLAGQLLTIVHRQSLIQPTAKEWKVPKKLMARFDDHSEPLLLTFECRIS
jgi:hypothetical protein